MLACSCTYACFSGAGKSALVCLRNGRITRKGRVRGLAITDVRFQNASPRCTTWIEWLEPREQRSLICRWMQTEKRR